MASSTSAAVSSEPSLQKLVDLREYIADHSGYFYQQDGQTIEEMKAVEDLIAEYWDDLPEVYYTREEVVEIVTECESDLVLDGESDRISDMYDMVVDTYDASKSSTKSHWKNRQVSNLVKANGWLRYFRNAPDLLSDAVRHLRSTPSNTTVVQNLHTALSNSIILSQWKAETESESSLSYPLLTSSVITEICSKTVEFEGMRAAAAKADRTEAKLKAGQINAITMQDLARWQRLQPGALVSHFGPSRPNNVHEIPNFELNRRLYFKSWHHLKQSAKDLRYFPDYQKFCGRLRILCKEAGVPETKLDDDAKLSIDELKAHLHKRDPEYTVELSRSLLKEKDQEIKTLTQEKREQARIITCLTFRHLLERLPGGPNTNSTREWQTFLNNDILPNAEYDSRNGLNRKTGELTHPVAAVVSKFDGKFYNKFIDSARNLYSRLSTNIHQFEGKRFEVNGDWDPHELLLMRALTPHEDNIKNGEVDWDDERKRHQ